MTILQKTGGYILFVSVFMLVSQVAVVTAQNRKGGVTVSYESLGSSRVARFTNSNSFHVRVEFSYNGTKVHGSAEASGKDAVFVPANYSATYGGHGTSELYRVKDIETRQPFLSRLAGVENVQMTTSDTSSPFVLIEAVPSSVGLADKLRNQVEIIRQQKRVREIDIE